MKFLQYIKRHRYSFSYALFVIIVATSFLVKTRPAHAIFGFGGKIASITICTCNVVPSYYIVLGPPMSGTYLVTELSTPYEFYNIWGEGGVWTESTYIPTLGPWILGSYTPGGVCLLVGEPCYPLEPPVGTVMEYGTSLGTPI